MGSQPYSALEVQGRRRREEAGVGEEKKR